MRLDEAERGRKRGGHAARGAIAAGAKGPGLAPPAVLASTGADPGPTEPNLAATQHPGMSSNGTAAFVARPARQSSNHSSHWSPLPPFQTSRDPALRTRLIPLSAPPGLTDPDG